MLKSKFAIYFLYIFESRSAGEGLLQHTSHMYLGRTNCLGLKVIEIVYLQDGGTSKSTVF